MFPSEAGQGVIGRSTGRYDSLVLDGLANFFGENAAGAKA
jgi:hypothetical protein